MQLILFKDKEIPPKESEWTNYFHVEAFYMENEKNIVAITATPNGPFIVEGNFKLIDREGKAEIRTGRIALCRCGKSYKQPFCDGTHRKIHYNDLSLK